MSSWIASAATPRSWQIPLTSPTREGDVVVGMDTYMCETTLTPDGADAVADLLRRAAARCRAMPDRIRSAQVRPTGEERSRG